jgi:hypothetical protein
MQKALFRNTMHELFSRLQSPRKRVMGKRQLRILDALLASDELTALSSLRAINFRMERTQGAGETWFVSPNLEWPSEITESEFFRRLKDLPRVKTLASMTASQE